MQSRNRRYWKEGRQAGKPGRWAKIGWQVEEQAVEGWQRQAVTQTCMQVVRDRKTGKQSVIGRQRYAVRQT